MTLRRIRAGDVIAGLAGLALLADLFAPWYREGGSGQSAWQALTVTLAFLLVTALLGTAVLVLTAFQRSQALPMAAELWGAALALPTAVLVLVRILDVPGDDAVVDVRWGAWVGLALVVGVLVGAVTSLGAERR